MKPILFYLLQVIAASGLLYGYYHFALRNKKFHRYNRFYLLMAVAISSSIPFLNIPVYFSQQEAESSVVLQTLQVISSPSLSNENPPVSIAVQTEPVTTAWFTSETVITFFYLFILSFFLLRVLISLNKIRFLIKRNTVEQLDKIRFINTNEPGTPFSFFRWLFWNRKIELHSDRGEQIFRHELFHIQQKHSWDIIFMELVSTVFWVNPFFHLIKKEVKAIHEFLADEFAIKENKNWQYAELLLMQVLNTNNRLVNPFFHNQIRRRIAMITTSQKPSYRYLRKIMVLPVAIIVVGLFAFSYKQNSKTKTEEIINIQDTIKPKPENILIKIPAPPLKPFQKTIPGEEHLKKWQDSKTYGVWIDSKRIDNVQLKNYNSSDFSHYFVSKLSENAVNYGKHYYQVDLMTNKFYEKYLADFDHNKQYSLTHKAARDTVPKVLEEYKDYLVTIDGEIKGKASLDSISPNSIESITVLKDKAAISKYGDKGKNGVIEIRTKNSVVIKEITLQDTIKKPLQDPNNIVFRKVEVEPSFPGGEKEWHRFLEKNISVNVPLSKNAPKGTYTVIIQFIVDREGNISDLKPLTNHGYGMEDEAMRVMSMSPKWKPGIQNGHIVNAYKKQPLTFVIGAGAKNLPLSSNNFEPSPISLDDPDFRRKWREMILEVKAMAWKEGKAGYVYRGRTYVFGRIINPDSTVASFTEQNGTDHVFLLNDELVNSVDELNTLIKRSDVKRFGFMKPEEALNRYNRKDPVVFIETYDEVITRN